MKNQPFRDRLLTLVPPERQAEAERILRQYSNDPNETVFWFFWLLANEQARTRAEIEKQKWLIHAIANPETWQRLVISRITGWVIVPMLLAATLFLGLKYLNNKNMTVIRKLSDNPEMVAAYAKDTLKALGVANENAAAIGVVADLLNLPDARAGLWNGQLAIIVPSNSITVETLNEREKRILLNGDLRKLRGILQRTTDDLEKNKPTPP